MSSSLNIPPSNSGNGNDDGADASTTYFPGGGGLRVQHGTPQADQYRHVTPDPTVIMRANGDMISVAPAYVKSSPGDNPAANVPPLADSVLDTAVSKTGRRLSRFEVTPDSLVSTPFGQVTVAGLLRTGQLRQDSQGKIFVPAASGFQTAGNANATSAPAASKPSVGDRLAIGDDSAQGNGNAFDKFDANANGQETANNGPAPEAVDAVVEQQLTELASTTQPTDQLVAVEQAIRNDGTLSDSMLNHLASTSGKTPQEVQGTVGAFIGALTLQATEAVDSVCGAESFEGFASWARTHASGELKAAMKAQATGRTTAGYKALATKYFAEMDRYAPDAVMAAAEEAGLRPRKVGGQVVLTIPGKGQYGWKTAVVHGLISVAK